MASSFVCVPYRYRAEEEETGASSSEEEGLPDGLEYGSSDDASVIDGDESEGGSGSGSGSGSEGEEEEVS